MRPGVVWFGEQLSRNELERVEDFLDGGACDVVIVAGTTATFGYIIDWALRGSRDGAELIEVNPEETPLSRFATRLVREPAAIALPRNCVMRLMTLFWEHTLPVVVTAAARPGCSKSRGTCIRQAAECYRLGPCSATNVARLKLVLAH